MRASALVVAVAVIAAAGCAGSAPVATPVPSPSSPSSPDAACSAIPLDGAAESLVVAVSRPIAPAAVTGARHPAERLALSTAYETLLRVSCRGELEPGLASVPVVGSDGVARLELRAGARFWDGAPLSAGSVIDAWRRTAATTGDALVARVAAAASADGPRTIAIALGGLPLDVLGLPTLTVTRERADSPWPVGTGDHRTGGGTAFSLVPLVAGRGPRVTFRTVTPAAARDVVDGTAAVLVADNRAVAAYAESRGARVTPLEWSTTYHLLLPSRAPPGAAFIDETAALATRLALARDAVRADARAAAMAQGARDARGACTMPLSGPPAATGPGGSGGDGMSGVSRASASETRARIAYAADDSVARGLAERLVALGAENLVAAPLSPAEFARALRTGGDRGYVVARQGTHGTGGAACASNLAFAAWLAGAAPWTSGTDGGTDPRAVLPLVDVRWTAIVPSALGGGR